jgi:hypothetical protein
MELMKKAPPELVMRLMRVANEMTPQERARLERLIGRINETDIPVIAEQIRGVPDDRLAKYLLMVADGIEQHERAEATAAATPAPTAG